MVDTIVPLQEYVTLPDHSEVIGKRNKYIKDLIEKTDDRTRGFSIEVAADLITHTGGRRPPLRVALLEAIGDEIGIPIPRTEMTNDPKYDRILAAKQVATAVVDVQKAHEKEPYQNGKGYYAKKLLAGKTGTDQMSITDELYGPARGLYWKEKVTMPVKVLAQNILFKMQTAFFETMSIPKNEVSEKLGRRSIWKEMVAVTPPETLKFQCLISERVDLEEPRELSAVLYSFAKSLDDAKDYARDSLQPVGYLQYSKTDRTNIVELKRNEPITVALYKKIDGVTRGKTIPITKEDMKKEKYNAGYIQFNDRLTEVVEDREGWLPLSDLSNSLIAVNLDPQKEVFIDEPVQDGFYKVGKDLRPSIVIYSGERTGEKCLTFAFDHLAFDGMFANALFKGAYLRQKDPENMGGWKDIGFLNGANYYFGEIRARSLSDRFSYIPETTTYEQMGKCVYAEFPADTNSVPADVLTSCSLWAYNSWLHRKKREGGADWELLPSSSAASITISNGGNPLEPLHPGGVWIVDPTRFGRESPFYNLRHVFAFEAALSGFKLNTSQVESGKMTFPERILSKYTDSKLKGRFAQKMAMMVTRSKSLTSLRAIAFPPTMIAERSGLIHNTVAGTDIPNVAFNREKGKVSMMFSVEDDSQFVKQSELMNFAKVIVPKASEACRLLVDWQKNGGDLEELNKKLDKLYFAF